MGQALPVRAMVPVGQGPFLRPGGAAGPLGVSPVEPSPHYAWPLLGMGGGGAQGRGTTVIRWVGVRVKGILSPQGRDGTWNWSWSPGFKSCFWINQLCDLRQVTSFLGLSFPLLKMGT